MKILMFSSDPAILDRESAAHARMQDYAELFQELHIVVPTRKETNSYSGKNLFQYPVYSSFGIGRPFMLWKTAYRLSQKIRFDVISVQSPDEIGLCGFLIARRVHTPFQIQIHTDMMSPWYRRASWKEWIRYRLARFLIPRADCVRVVSQRIAHSLKSQIPNPKQIPNSKIAVLPIFTDISRFLNAEVDPEIEERFRGHTFKMIVAGRFVDKEKNFSMLIDVIRDFVKVCPEALLVIVGDGPDRENYKSQIINCKLEKNVLLEQWRNDLPSFYKSFDLFVLPSNYEGWGRAVIEAMAAGLPVLMNDVGLAGEVVKNGINGVIVPVGDRDAFLAALVDLYKNSETRKRLARAGKETVQELMPPTKPEYLIRYKKSFEVCVYSSSPRK